MSSVFEVMGLSKIILANECRRSKSMNEPWGTPAFTGGVEKTPALEISHRSPFIDFSTTTHVLASAPTSFPLGIT